MDFQLSTEHRALRATVRDFAREVVAPVIGEHYEKHTFPYEIVRQMGKMGLFGLPFPEAYGGEGGDYLALCGLTEPGFGSDAGGTQTHAVQDPATGEWLINGSKAFITNSGTEITSLVTVTALTGPDEISAFIVPAGTPGFSVGPGYSKVGWCASDTHPLHL